MMTVCCLGAGFSVDALRLSTLHEWAVDALRLSTLHEWAVDTLCLSTLPRARQHPVGWISASASAVPARGTVTGAGSGIAVGTLGLSTLPRGPRGLP